MFETISGATRSQATWTKPWPLIALILAVGIGLSLAAFRFGVGWETNELETSFTGAAKMVEVHLRRELENNINAVRALRAYFESDREEVSFKEFKIYTQMVMSQHKGIQALEWIPRVSSPQRATFEEKGKLAFDPNFQITEMSAGGQPVRAGLRSEYFPVYYIEPVKGNRQALGFDLASDATRLAALNAARESGRATASGRIQLIQESGVAFGFLIYSPVFARADGPVTQTKRNDQLRGFALGVFRIPDIVQLAVPDFTDTNINLFLFDDSGDGSSQSLLFGYCPDNPKLAEQPDIACVIKYSGTDLHYQARLKVGDRNWILVVVATPGYQKGHYSSLPHAILAMGLLATLLSALLVLRDAKTSQEILAKNLALQKEIIERRNAETRLAVFKYTVAKMRDAAYLMNSNGEFVFVNDSACAALGYSREELLEMALSDIDLNLLPEQWGQRWLELTEAKHLSMESWHRRKSGESFPVELSMNLVEYEGEQFNCAFARDITERKQAEQELLVRDELFRGVSHMAQVGGWEYDIPTGEGYWSEEIARIHDMDPEDETSKSIGLGFYQGEHLAKIQQALREAEQDGKPFDLELELITNKGNRKWARSIGWPVMKGNVAVKLRGAFQDITERKRAETDLKESENKFRSITENAADYIFIKDQSRRYSFINNAMQKLLDMPYDAILGKTPEEIFGQDQGHKVKDVDDRTFAGETVNETIMLTLRGKRFFFNTIQTPLSMQDGKVTSIMGIVRDVTDIKEAEEALKSSQALMKNIFEASPALITLTTVEEGRYLDANSAYLTATGYSYEEVVGKTSIELGIWIDPEDRAETMERLQRDGTLQDYEVRFRMKNGETKDFLWNAVMLEVEGTPCSVNVMIDISDRLYAERAIKENEEALSQHLAEINHIYQTSPVGLAFVDREFRYLRINQTLAELNGVPVQDHIGKTIAQVHPGLVSQLEPLYQHVLATGQPVTNMSIHGAASSNPELERDWLINYYPVKASSGSIMGVGTVAQDITELKEAERALTRINEELEDRVTQRTAELEAANKELEAFAYSVSHDLRAPLRALDGFSQALLEDHQEDLDQEGKDYLSRIRAASQRMGELIDDILQLSRITRSEMQPMEVDLSQLALEIADHLQAGDPQRNAEFLIQPAIKATGDEKLLGILLENLLGNAWKYTSRQPSARIEFGAFLQEGESSAGIGPEKAYFVRDNGVGFDTRYMNKLFQPFQRLHSAEDFPGTGIGLATAQRIINRHRGLIWAESQEGAGATFFFTLLARGGQ